MSLLKIKTIRYKHWFIQKKVDSVSWAITPHSVFKYYATAAPDKNLWLAIF